MLDHFALAETIRTSKARYCRYMDTQNWAEFAALFAREPTIRFFGEDGIALGEFDSLDEFLAATKAYLAGARTIHQVHNDEIEVITEEEVRAIWSMEDYLLFPDGDDVRPASMHGYGHYHETWRLEDGQWRLAHLELHRTILEIKPKEIAA
ncbi:nuclear transport factor 2 family protein [Sinorhizobium medicae]|uniref:nuclear transport factor 2 family protein n=1 Tax=Sinorhizobium medicae TaxID=110321 RepID=UPI000FDBE4DB|nr:nuclear transport factor 2 family protein [Sinorhizobium medicae]MDX0480403.1 nuclear transport factor 2 family protein [Sinorhizobium medicae]MDX0685226.1 nuclear transport factor 2 family protein [Sinorhizobium medicae]MDX0838461.1 nuclear transport factor 2 family protein [Sinorhizobium medicae]MDX0899854.1 nuclear transport factor 2 family protein [Sinorhizobium medicae]